MSRDFSLYRREIAADLLVEDVASETAGSLGRAGRQVEHALEALRGCPLGDEARPRLLHLASEAVYWLFIQRELCGAVDQDEAIQVYGIPEEVLLRLGCR